MAGTGGCQEGQPAFLAIFFIFHVHVIIFMRVLPISHPQRKKLPGDFFPLIPFRFPAPFKPFFYRRFFIKKEKRKGARRKSAVSPFPISLFPGPRQSLPPSWGKVAKASETKLLTDEGNTAYSGRRNLLYGRVYAYAGLSFV